MPDKKPKTTSPKAKATKAKAPKLEEKPLSPNRDKYHNEKNRFKPGNPGRPKGSVGKITTFRKTLMNVFEKLGGEDALLNYLSQNVVYKNGVPVAIKYDKNNKGEISEVNSERFEKLLSLMAKTIPKTEAEEEEQNENTFEAKMQKIEKQLESNPGLKNKMIDGLTDGA